jgi:hypothetical protein
VPGDAVPAVAVVAQAGGAERLAQLGSVVCVERAVGRVQRGIGQRLALVVEAEQPGYVDDALVHLAALGAPRHAVAQPLEQRVRAAQPAPPQVDPGAVAERGAAHGAVERTGRDLVPVRGQRVEQGGLERGRHGTDSTLFWNRCTRPPRGRHH